MSYPKHDACLDARRLLCPMPVIKTQNAMKTLSPGQTLKVICTDPGAEHDVPTWCKINGHTVLGVYPQPDTHELWIFVEAAI